MLDRSVCCIITMQVDCRYLPGCLLKARHRSDLLRVCTDQGRYVLNHGRSGSLGDRQPHGSRFRDWVACPTNSAYDVTFPGPCSRGLSAPPPPSGGGGPPPFEVSPPFDGCGGPRDRVSEEAALLNSCAAALQRNSARKSAPRGVWIPFSSPLLTVLPSLADS